MKTVKALTESITDAREEIERIVDRATVEERELTNEESSRTEALLAQIEQESEQREQREKLDDEIKFKAAEKFAHLIGGSVSGPSMQHDSRGNEFCMLKKGEKFADIKRPKCEHQFGHYIGAKLFGATAHTPESVRVMAAQKEGDGSLGGFTVPSEMLGEVIDLARSRSVLMDAGVRSIVMSGPELRSRRCCRT